MAKNGKTGQKYEEFTISDDFIRISLQSLVEWKLHVAYAFEFLQSLSSRGNESTEKLSANA